MWLLLCTEGAVCAAVKRLTDDKVLRAELHITGSGDADADGAAQQLQVMLYDKQLNINSTVAQHRVTFPADTSQLSSFVFCYIAVSRRMLL